MFACFFVVFLWEGGRGGRGVGWGGGGGNRIISQQALIQNNEQMNGPLYTQQELIDFSWQPMAQKGAQDNRRYHISPKKP